MLMKKTVSLSLIIALLATPLLSYAQSSGTVETDNTENTTALVEPSQTTIFFADPEKAKEIVETADTTYLSDSQTTFSADTAQTAIKELDQ